VARDDDAAFEEKYAQVLARLGVGDADPYVERIVYGELRRNPHEDAGVLSLRIKAQLARGR
jgi:hypothetical protein